MSRAFNTRAAALGASVFVILITLAVALGWQFDIAALKSVLPGYISMKINTALGLFNLAMALFIFARGGTRRSGAAVSLFAGAIGVLTLVQYIFHVNLGIDELLFNDTARSTGVDPPGRLAPITALSFVLVSVANHFAFVAARPRFRLAHSLYFLAALLSFQAIVSYALGMQSSFGLAGYTRIALHTAASIIAVTAGFCALTSQEGLLRIIFSDTQAGLSARRLLLAALFVPSIVSYLEGIGRAAGLYDADFGLLFRLMGSTLFFVVMVLRTTESWFVAEEKRRAKEVESLRLRDERETARARESAKAEFLARMSHEIRTPLNGIIGITDLLSETRMDDRQREYVKILRESGGGLLTVINDILDYSKVEAGRVELEKLDFNLHALVSAQAALLRPRAEEKFLKIELEIDPELPASFTGDSGRIGQILLNFISNAIKFTEVGPIVVRVRGQEGGLRFSVKDEGIGLTAPQLERLFQPFAQADVSTSRKYGGTGLGLSICKYLIDLMQGEIGVESEAGGGSEFWFKLNLPVAPASAGEKTTRPTGPLKFGRNVRVLLAEDNRVNQLIAREQLKQLGVDVKTVMNGKEALDVAGAEDFDLIFMDCHMPEMDGYEATGLIRALEKKTGRHVPIVALTASVMVEDRDRCVNSGMDDYMAKPFTREQMADTLRKWIPPEGLATRETKRV